MLLRPLRFISLLLTALATGIAWGAALERPGKRALSGAVYVDVQQQLYRAFGKPLAFIEGGALLSTVTTLPLLARRPIALALTGLGAVNLAAMTVVWGVLMAPISRRVNRWNDQRLPDDWRRTRTRLERLHTVRAVLGFCALVSLLLPAVAEGGKSLSERLVRFGGRLLLARLRH